MDSNLDTESCTDYGDGKWLQAKFDGVHCVRNVMWYYYSDTPVTTWACDQTGCDCEGSYCSWATLNVGNEERAAGDRTDCLYGDNIKITFSETFMVAFSELAITEIEGKIFYLSPGVFVHQIEICSLDLMRIFILIPLQKTVVTVVTIGPR